MVANFETQIPTGNFAIKSTCYDPESSLTNNILDSNNRGISVYGCSPTILNNTIVDNSNYGVHCIDSPSPRIANSIIWRNGDDLFGCTASYSDISDGDLGTGNISVNPMFADASGGDYHLQSNSLCIDAGTNTGAPTEDIEGNARPQDGDGIGGAVTDMGAYEYVPAPVPAIEADVDFAPNTLNLRSNGKWITCYIVPERKPHFLSFRPQGEILNVNINNTIRFLATLEMTVLLSFRSGTIYLNVARNQNDLQQNSM